MASWNPIVSCLLLSVDVVVFALMLLVASPPCPARYTAFCKQVSSSRLHLLSSHVFLSSSSLQLLICVIFTSISSSSVSSSGVNRTNDMSLSCWHKNSHILGHVRRRFQRISKSMDKNRKGEKSNRDEIYRHQNFLGLQYYKVQSLIQNNDKCKWHTVDCYMVQ